MRKFDYSFLNNGLLPASLVSLYMFSRCILYLYTLGKTPNISLTILPGLDEEGRADLLSGSAA